MLKDTMFTSPDARAFLSDVIRLGEESGFGVTPIHQARNIRGGCPRPPQNPTVGAFCGKPLVPSLLVLCFGILPGMAQTAGSWPQRKPGFISEVTGNCVPRVVLGNIARLFSPGAGILCLFASKPRDARRFFPFGRAFGKSSATNAKCFSLISAIVCGVATLGNTVCNT